MEKFAGKELTKYDFPVSRIGEVNSPKFIILLENQASDPRHFQWNPEYTIWLDGKFTNSDSHSNGEGLNRDMDFDTVIKYDKWWFELHDIWKNHIHNNEVLALEYYPYATQKGKNGKAKEKEIYKDDWDKDDGLAMRAKMKNKEILLNALNNNIPIFVYYMSGWYNDSDIDLGNRKDNELISHYEKDKTKRLPHSIKRRLVAFLNNELVINRIEELRKSECKEKLGK